MKSSPAYKYRFWGHRWLTWFLIGLGMTSLWSEIQWYDLGSAEVWFRLRPLIVLQILALILFWRLLCVGRFKFRIAFYGVWTGLVVTEVFQSVVRHDGMRFLMSIGLGMLVYALYLQTEDILDQAQVNPQLKWYEGKLSAIPHLSAQLRWDETEVAAQLRSIDEQGAFLLLVGKAGRLRRSQKVKVTLKYKTFEVEVEGRPVASLEWEQRGFGLQFSFNDLYHQNQYTGLVKQLKGEGLA